MKADSIPGVAALLLAAWFVRLLAMHASGAGLYVDEAQYWDWSRDLAWGYWSKPPVIAALIAASTAAFGDSVTGLRIVATMTWPLAGLCLWWLGRSIAGARAGAWAAVIFIGTLVAGVLGQVATTDGPLVLCWAAAMACCWHAIVRADAGRPALAWWIATGMAIGIGILSKYTMGAVALSFAWLAWERPRERMRGMAVAAAVAAIVALPNVLWNASNGWPTLAHTADITVAAHGQAGWNPWASVLEFAGSQLLLLGPVALVTWYLGSRESRRGGTAASPAERAGQRFALAFAIPLFAIGLAQSAHAIAQVNWAAPSFVGVSLWIALRVAPLLGDIALLSSWVGGVALAAGLSLAGTLARPAAVHDGAIPAKFDMWSRMRGWDPAIQAFEPLLRANPGLPIAATRRDLVAHASYSLRSTGRSVMAWPASGRPANHYEQFRALCDASRPCPPEVLVITAADGPEERMRATYPRWELLQKSRWGRVEVQLWKAAR